MTIDLVRARSNLDRLSLWRSRLGFFIKKNYKWRSKERFRAYECASCLSAWVHMSGSVWEAHSWSLGVRGSQARVYHFMTGDSEIGRQSGMESAVLDCEFISQTKFRDCKFLNFPWVWNRKIHWMLFFPSWVSEVKYLCQMCMIFCVFPLCILGLIPMYFQLSFSAVLWLLRLINDWAVN